MGRTRTRKMRDKMERLNIGFTHISKRRVWADYGEISPIEKVKENKKTVYNRKRNRDRVEANDSALSYTG